MNDIKGEDSLKAFPENRGNAGGYGCRPGMNLDLRNEFIDGKKNQKCQDKGNQILNQKTVNKGQPSGIDMGCCKAGGADEPVQGCPDGGYGQGDKENKAQSKHDDVFHQAVIKE